MNEDQFLFYPKLRIFFVQFNASVQKYLRNNSQFCLLESSLLKVAVNDFEQVASIKSEDNILADGLQFPNFLDFVYIEDVKEYVASPLGKTRMVDQRGFVYVVNRYNQVSGKAFWRCSMRKIRKCPVNAVTLQNKITKISGEHNHQDPNPQIEHTTPKCI